MKIALTKPLPEGQHELPDDLAKALMHAGYGFNAEEEIEVDRVIEEIVDTAYSYTITLDYEAPPAWQQVIPLLKAAPRLLAACRMVVDHWETVVDHWGSGDLADAARACGEAVEGAMAV